MKVRFTANFLPSLYRSFGIKNSDRLFLVQCKQDEYARLYEELKKLAGKVEENRIAGKDDIDLDITVDILYRKRSLEANALMWALYTLIAEALNRENKTRKPVTPQELYDEDMAVVAPKHRIECRAESVNFFTDILSRERGRIREITDHPEMEGWKVIEVWQTSSFWNTSQMSVHIERLLNTLDDMKITQHTNGDLKKVFDDFTEWRKKNADERTESRMREE
jgi:hypothetical protein